MPFRHSTPIAIGVECFDEITNSMKNNIAYQFEILNITRTNILNLMDSYPLEKLNEIPGGFSNNLIWNFGHVVVTQQLLMYALSGLPMKLEDDIIAKYRRGSKPEADVSKEEYDMLRQMASALPGAAFDDYKNGVFKEYKSYPTSYGITLNSIEEAIAFNNVHEGMHFGTMLGICKLL